MFYIAYQRLLQRLFQYLARKLYPDKESRAIAFAAESAELYQIVCFGSGDPFERLIVIPHESEGYIVHVDCKSDMVKNDETAE